MIEKLTRRDRTSSVVPWVLAEGETRRETQVAEAQRTKSAKMSGFGFEGIPSSELELQKLAWMKRRAREDPKVQTARRPPFPDIATESRGVP